MVGGDEGDGFVLREVGEGVELHAFERVLVGDFFETSEALFRSFFFSYFSCFSFLSHFGLGFAEGFARFTSLAAIDKPDVRVMYNPGGTNESFVKANLHHADCRIFAKNVDIPHQIVLGKADVMITETVEAAFYLRRFPELAAPLIDQPFTHEAFCIAMSPKCANWVGAINHILAKLRASGKLQEMAQRCIGWPPHANHTESREENR